MFALLSGETDEIVTRRCLGELTAGGVIGAAEDSSDGIVNTVLTLWVISTGLAHSDCIMEDDMLDTSDTSGVNMRSAAKIRRGTRPGRPVRFASGRVRGRTGSGGNGVTPDEAAKFSWASLTTSTDRNICK